MVEVRWMERKILVDCSRCELDTGETCEVCDARYKKTLLETLRDINDNLREINASLNKMTGVLRFK